MRILANWLNTAPKIRSDKVLAIEKAGLMPELIKGIEQERRGEKQTGRIKVKRVQ